MATLTTQSYAIDDGDEFVAYLTHVSGECDRLQEEGRIPADEGVHDFLALLRVLAARVRSDVGKGRAAGLKTLQTGIDMTPAEYARTRSMADSLRPLLEILELRQAVDLRRTEGAMRVTAAVLQGTYVE